MINRGGGGGGGGGGVQIRIKLSKKHIVPRPSAKQNCSTTKSGEFVFD